MLFFRLGSAPIQLWDESRQAVNAAEMLANHRWLVTYFDGQPDLWNTKPPLLIWLQAGSIRLLGYSPLAVRLPSALAALGTVLLVAWFGWRQLGQWLTGWLAALVLLSTSGFVAQHVARTGDYDALLLLWTTLGGLMFFRYLREQRAYLAWLAAGAFTLAALTKGIAGVLDAPALLLWAALCGRLGWLLRRPAVYGSGLLLGLVVGGYYLARELAAPGYLAAVDANELGGRALHVLDNHRHPWDYYLSLVADVRFTPWLGLAVVGGLLELRQPQGAATRQFALLAALVVGWHLLVISAAQTKLPWYDAPVYPWLALLAARGLTQLFEATGRQLRLRPTWWGPVALGLLLVGAPYNALRLQLDREHNQRFVPPTMRFGHYLPLQARQQQGIQRYTVLEPTPYNASLLWYRLALEASTGLNVTCVNGTPPPLMTGQTVVVCVPALARQLRQRYATRTLFAADSCVTLRIVGPTPAVQSEP